MLHRKPGIEPRDEATPLAFQVRVTIGVTKMYNVYVSRVLSSGVVVVLGRGNIDLSPVLQAMLLICSP